VEDTQEKNGDRGKSKDKYSEASCPRLADIGLQICTWGWRRGCDMFKNARPGGAPGGDLGSEATGKLFQGRPEVPENNETGGPRKGKKGETTKPRVGGGTTTTKRDDTRGRA